MKIRHIDNVCDCQLEPLTAKETKLQPQLLSLSAMFWNNAGVAIKEHCGYCFTKAVFLWSKTAQKKKQYTKQNVAPHLDERRDVGALKTTETQGRLSLAFCLSAEAFAHCPKVETTITKQHKHKHMKCMTYLNTALHQSRSSGYGSKKKATYCRRLCQHIRQQSIVSESLRWACLKCTAREKYTPDGL